MQTFRTFYEERKKKSLPIPFPIHFKFVELLKKIPIPIHFKHLKEDEEHTDFKHWRNHTPHSQRLEHKPEEGAIFKYNKTKHVKITTEKHSEHLDLNDDHKSAIRHYTDSSGHINSHLIRSHRNPHDSMINAEPIGEGSHHTIKHLDDAIKKNPLKHNLHAYSGVGFDPRKHIDHTGHMHSPAYISTSHDKNVVLSFAHTHDDNSMHIMHFHLKKDDPAIHIHKHSSMPGEHETIVARDQKLKYHGTITYHRTVKDRDVDAETPGGPWKYKKTKYPVHVHHFSIAKHD